MALYQAEIRNPMYDGKGKIFYGTTTGVAPFDKQMALSSRRFPSNKQHQHNEEYEEGRGHEGKGDVAEFKHKALAAISCASLWAWEYAVPTHLEIMHI